jgi:hypothetical protein
VRPASREGADELAGLCHSLTVAHVSIGPIALPRGRTSQYQAD